jgi:hypothetical protein
VPGAVTKCPDCGSNVSQFAAGCAICGADLVAAREARERRREALPSLAAPGWFPQVTGTDLIVGALLLLAAFASPLVGGPIAGLFAYFANQRDDVVQRNFALAALAAALLVVILVSFLPGTYSWFFPWVDLSSPVPN